jgi:hypothetical protein
MKRLRIIRITLLIYASSVMGLAARQSKTTTPQNEPATVANAWMMVPTQSMARLAGITESLRADRDRFWDSSMIAAQVPLTKAVVGAALSEGDGDSGPEIPKISDRAILTATFVKYRSILTASERAVYTEVTFQVSDVYQVLGVGHIIPGSDVTVALPGGTVISSSGQLVSFLTQPRELFLQPGRKYLLVLSYRSVGDFYTVARHWDISDGVVRPNTSMEQMRAKNGRSSLSDIPTSQLGSKLSSLLSAETQ